MTYFLFHSLIAKLINNSFFILKMPISPLEMSILLKLVASMLLGGIIGLEREFNKSAAGIKTYAIVCMGSALFTLAAATVNISLAAGIITGIGFLGAAMVFKNEKGTVGLTTAALVWSTAAIGFVVGLGMYFASITATVLLLVILIPVEYVEKKLLKTHQDNGF
jgi:putative Mg2+ transporter-C (MgtC) family protein